jgi:hypothetical protein
MFAVACIPTYTAGALNGKHKYNSLCVLCGEKRQEKALTLLKQLLLDW